MEGQSKGSEENKGLVGEIDKLGEKTNELMDKYGVKETVVGDAINGVIDDVKGSVEFGGALIDKGKSIFDRITETKEEKAEIAAAEAAEIAAAKQAEEEAKAEEEAEKQRLEELKDQYIMHSAMITCSFAVRPSRVQIPISHGAYVHGIEMLNVGDSIPLINIQSFGVCTSPKNPTVQAAAAAIQAEVATRRKGFVEKVMDFFCGSKEEEKAPGADLVSQCAGVCTPLICMPWVDGKETVLIDNKQALLGRCTLACLYDGGIEIYSDGICQEMIEQVEKTKKAQEVSKTQDTGGKEAIQGEVMSITEEKSKSLKPLAGRRMVDGINIINKQERTGEFGAKYGLDYNSIIKFINSKEFIVLMAKTMMLSPHEQQLLKEVEKILKTANNVIKNSEEILEKIDQYNEAYEVRYIDKFVNEKTLKCINPNWDIKKFEKAYGKGALEKLKNEMKKAKLVDQRSILMYLCTITTESGYGTARVEYRKNFEGLSYTEQTKGAGLSQITGITQKSFLEYKRDRVKSEVERNNIKKQIAGFEGDKICINKENPTKFIADNYPIESSVWHWMEFELINLGKINGKEIKYSMNDFILKSKGKNNNNIFTVTQMLTNGSGYIRKALIPIAEYEQDFKIVKVAQCPKDKSLAHEHKGMAYCFTVPGVPERHSYAPNGWEDRYANWKRASKLLED